MWFKQEEQIRVKEATGGEPYRNLGAGRAERPAFAGRRPRAI